MKINSVFDTKAITPDTKMVDLLRNNLNLLFVLNQFSIPLGFGEKTIQEVCVINKVDTQSLITLIQFHDNPDIQDIQRMNTLSPNIILNYLKKSHNYFIDYRLPEIRQQFATSLNEGSTRKTILSYFEDYEKEVRDHMGYEDKVFFPYIENLLDGKEQKDYSVKLFKARHNNIEEKLDDLINLIIKYLPTSGYTLRLIDVLEDLRVCNRDLYLHSFLEDKILIPKIKRLEKNIPNEEIKVTKKTENLSNREKDIVRSVAKGLSNKEIADRHFLSIHTVITHRRNISRKLGIHSSAGLTVYAILNKLVDIEDLR